MVQRAQGDGESMTEQELLDKVAELQQRLDRVNFIRNLATIDGECWVSEFGISKAEWVGMDENAKHWLVARWADTVKSELDYETAQAGNVSGRAQGTSEPAASCRV